MNIREINNIDEKELDIYARVPERQLMRIYEPNPGLFIAESIKILERALDAKFEPISLLITPEILSGDYSHIIDKCGDIPVYVGKEEVLDKLTGFHLTGGVLCAMKRREMPSPSDILDSSNRIVILDSVQNPTNVGAIFRSAAALGMDGCLVTTSCSDPLYRRAIRVSMGNVFQIPWTYMNSKALSWPQEGLQLLKDHGYKTAAMALKKESVSIADPALKSEKKLVIIMGSEGYGLSDDVIDNCDYVIKIPMHHGVDSLNVASASALAFWELGNK